MKDEECSGRRVKVDDDQIKALIDYDRHSLTRDIAEKVDVSHTCGFLDTKRRLTHILGECELTGRLLGLCDMLLKRNANDPCLKQTVTGNTWLCMTTFCGKDSGLRKANRHQKKECYQFGGITKA